MFLKAQTWHEACMFFVCKKDKVSDKISGEEQESVAFMSIARTGAYCGPELVCESDVQ